MPTLTLGDQLAEVRREHADGATVAKAVISALMITGGPVACYDELLQSTNDAHVAAGLRAHQGGPALTVPRRSKLRHAAWGGRLVGRISRADAR